MLGLRFYNVVAWDAMIFGIWEIWARAKGVAMFGVWGTQLDHVIFMVFIFVHDT
jgi:hypothetical protein